ncbi:hypothetical protein U9M48_030968 [Paspalum notatum var. saurae]|uniref:Uncharacterized protein n=1 Tax=Paspalum notatum var. saurae TaxID=547442 RepID=A0AAQ3U4S1_PASNO
MVAAESSLPSPPCLARSPSPPHLVPFPCALRRRGCGDGYGVGCPARSSGGQAGSRGGRRHAMSDRLILLPYAMAAISRLRGAVVARWRVCVGLLSCYRRWLGIVGAGGGSDSALGQHRLGLRWSVGPARESSSAKARRTTGEATPAGARLGRRRLCGNGLRWRAWATSLPWHG